jgi:Putative DNA-binding domain
MLLNVPLNNITEDALQSLIGLEEGRQIEFKLTLPDRSNDGCKEFLKDVSALANTFGGDIYYGVRSGANQNGHTVATAVEGVSGVDADAELLRLENLIRDSIKPRIVGYGMKPVHLSNSNTVFIVRVPRSWNCPHVVDRQGHWRFYYRNSSGCHPMDVSEVRAAMLSADRVAQRLGEFRIERLALIANDTSLDPGGKIVLHIQPADSANPETQVDLSRARQILSQLEPIFSWPSAEFERRPNFDGINIACEGGARRYGYVQLFRNGAIEAVDTRLLGSSDIGQSYIPVRHFEHDLGIVVRSYLSWMSALGIVSPVRLHLSLLGVKGYCFSFGDTRSMVGHGINAMAHFNRFAHDRIIDRPDLLLVGEDLDSPDADPQPALKRWIDTVWNAAGLERSDYPYL